MNEFRVGLLAIGTMISIVFMSYKITSNQAGFGDYQEYRTYIKDASGIFPKTPIKVAGINAGRIKEISLDGTKALITFEVLRKVSIPIDSKLKIKSVGFLGDKYLEIVIGKSDKLMEVAGVMEAVEGDGLENLVKDASDVLKDVKTVVQSIKETFVPEGKEPILKKIMSDVDEMVDNAKKFAKTLNKITSENESKITNLISDLEKFSKAIKEQTDVNNPQSSIADIKKILEDGKQIAADLKTIVADVKNGKGTLGKFLVEEGLADQVSETLSGVNKLVNKMDTIRTEISAYTGVNTEFGSDTRASLKIFPAPERFYLLGISTSDFGPTNERHTTIVENGARTNRVESYRDKDVYRFDVQLGRKFHYLTLRGGLIESTGGLGIDFEAPRMNSIFGMDVFDYRTNVGVNLRLTYELQIWNVIHAKAMAEDIINKNRSFTFLTGLKFTDDDIKGLIGFFL